MYNMKVYRVKDVKKLLEAAPYALCRHVLTHNVLATNYISFYDQNNSNKIYQHYHHQLYSTTTPLSCEFEGLLIHSHDIASEISITNLEDDDSIVVSNTTSKVLLEISVNCSVPLHEPLYMFTNTYNLHGHICFNDNPAYANWKIMLEVVSGVIICPLENFQETIGKIPYREVKSVLEMIPYKTNYVLKYVADAEKGYEYCTVLCTTFAKSYQPLYDHINAKIRTKEDLIVFNSEQKRALNDIGLRLSEPSDSDKKREEKDSDISSISDVRPPISDSTAASISIPVALEIK